MSRSEAHLCYAYLRNFFYVFLGLLLSIRTQPKRMARHPAIHQYRQTSSIFWNVIFFSPANARPAILHFAVCRRSNPSRTNHRPSIHEFHRSFRLDPLSFRRQNPHLHRLLPKCGRTQIKKLRGLQKNKILLQRMSSGTLEGS